MDARERQIADRQFRKMGFEPKGPNLVMTKGKVEFTIHMRRYDKIVAVARGMGDTRLHTSTPGRAVKEVKRWLSEIKPKKPYGGS